MYDSVIDALNGCLFYDIAHTIFISRHDNNDRIVVTFIGVLTL